MTITVEGFLINDDSHWIIMLFFIYIDSFQSEKKMEESTHMTIFTDRTHFGKLGSETFRENFDASNNFFGELKLFHFSVALSSPALDTKTFPMAQ